MPEAKNKAADRSLTLIIDGQEVPFTQGMTVLEAAKAKDIYIPHLCWHEDLPPFGACRLCVVEIEGMRGFQASCSTPAQPGMVVRTDTEELLKIRRGVLELILSEHPTGCLFCVRKDQCEEFRGPGHLTKAGKITGCMLCPELEHCELRKLVERLGLESCRFGPTYKSIPVERLDPFFDRDYNLCILCGRCVRVCEEVRGVGTLSFIKRGPETRVGTAFGQLHLDLDCQFCGACVDVCPTGALSDRTTKWEPKPESELETACALCPVGCSIEVSHPKSNLVSCKASQKRGVNDGQVCVLGRFAIPGLVNSRHRFQTPMVRKFGQLLATTWEDALTVAAEGISRFSASERALLFPGFFTDEELYVFTKFATEVLQTENYPKRDRTKKWSGLDASLSNISDGDAILLVGADLFRTHPILGLNVRRAVNRGAKLITVDTIPTFLDRFSSLSLRAKPGGFSWVLAGLVWSLVHRQATADSVPAEGSKRFPAWAFTFMIEEIAHNTGASDEELMQACELLLSSRKKAVIAGPEVGAELSSRRFEGLMADLCAQLKKKNGSCSTAQALISRDFDEHWLRIIDLIENNEVKALVMSGDLIPKLRPKGRNPLENLEFLLVIDNYRGWHLPYADVILPSTAYVESEGTFAGVDGYPRIINRAVRPPGKPKPKTEIASLLAKAMDNTDFGCETLSKTKREMSGASRRLVGLRPASTPKPAKSAAPSESSMKGSGDWPLLLVNRCNSYLYQGHRITKLVEGVRALCGSDYVRISPSLAEEFDIKHGEIIHIESERGRTSLVAEVDPDIPDGLLVTLLTGNDPRLLALMGREQVGASSNTTRVRLEPNNKDSHV